MLSETSLNRFFHKAFPTFGGFAFAVIAAGVSLDLILEYTRFEHPFFIWKDVVDLVIMLTAFAFYRMGKLQLGYVVILSMFVVLVSIYVSTFFWDLRQTFEFSTYYIKFELISWLFIVLSAILFNNRVIFSILVFKLIHTFTVMLSPYAEDSGAYVIFLFLTVVAGGLLVFLNKRITNKLNQREEEMRNEIKAQLESGDFDSKMDLLHILGHDVKQPFNQISSLAALLDDDAPPIPREEIIDMMNKAVKNGISITNSLLSWASASSALNGKGDVRCDVRNALHDAIEDQSSAIGLKRIEVIENLQPQSVQLDHTVLLVCVRNLISNAVKYSVDGSAIFIRNYATEGSAHIEIKDQGVGMTADQVQKLLEKGKNESLSGTRNEPGNGLGLEIVKDLLNRQEARLHIESVRQKGTTMTIVCHLANA
ncbi:MAG: hypothetical protein KDC12_13620 [Flavobacteriales bacterium]|nr:hypothetical protein [Flavobacteriales bacterium]